MEGNFSDCLRSPSGLEMFTPQGERHFDISRYPNRFAGTGRSIRIANEPASNSWQMNNQQSLLGLDLATLLERNRKRNSPEAAKTYSNVRVQSMWPF